MTKDDLLEHQVWRLYLSLLGRPPDETGLQGCISALKGGSTVEDLFSGILASDEFRHRTRRLLDDFWISDGDPRIGIASDYARRQNQKIAVSRNSLRDGSRHERRLAVVAPYPPAHTGVAMATLRTFEQWRGGVDFFGDFDSADQLLAAQDRLRQGNSSHRVLSHAVLPEALPTVHYDAVVFAFGNSVHNVHVVHWLLRANEITPSHVPIIAHVHDPIMFDVLRTATTAQGHRFDILFAQAYGSDLTEEYMLRRHRALLDAGICGMRVISRATRVDHIIVNSMMARKIILRDDPDLDPAKIHDLFHPVFSVAKDPHEIPAAREPGPIRVGSFGVATESKRFELVIEALKILSDRGRSILLTIAGYEAGRVSEQARRSGQPVDIHENPSDSELLELMDRVDVAVQLRALNTGETSGVVSLLLGLAKPVVVTAVGAFLEFGPAVRFVDRNATAEEVAEAILSAYAETDAISAEARTYAANRSPKIFCDRLAAILATGESLAGPLREVRASEREGPPANWMAPARTCILAFSPRSGSTYLAHLMRTTGLLGWPDEYFNLGYAAQAYPEASGQIPRLCAIAADRGRSENGVVSFKVLPEHFDHIQKSVRLSAWFPNPCWVRLRRRDLLGQAISLAIADQTQIWDSRFKTKRSPVFSAGAVQRALTRIVEDNARWDIFFTRNGLAPLTILYEDLERDPASIVSAIAAQLGVNQALAVRPEDVPISKQRTETNEEWRSLYLREARNADHIDGLCSADARDARETGPS